MTAGEEPLDFFQQGLLAPVPLALPAGRVVREPTCFLRFAPWTGDPIPRWIGNKAVLVLDGEPLYAELAIQRLLQKEGWDGVWVDGFQKKFRTGLPAHGAVRDLPDEACAVLDRISGGRGFPRGCWDVFAWRGERVLFAESKRRGKDLLQDSQRRWLEAGLAAGVPLECRRASAQDEPDVPSRRRA